MAFQLYSVVGTGPRFNLNLTEYVYSDIIPTNTIYSGGFFAIQEVATIVLDITDPKLIDTDFNYFEPNRFLGSWQILRNTGILAPGGGFSYEFGGTNEPTEQGFFLKTVCKLDRISYHSIGDLTAQPRLGGVSHVDNCNFFTIGATIEVGPLTLTGELQEAEENIYLTRNYITPPPLQTKTFSPILASLGVFIKPGVALLSARWDCSAINILSTDTAIEQAFSCRVVADVDCNQIAIDYTNNNANAYLTQGDCLNANPGGNCQVVNIIIDNRCGPTAIWEVI